MDPVIHRKRSAYRAEVDHEYFELEKIAICALSSMFPLFFLMLGAYGDRSGRVRQNGTLAPYRRPLSIRSQTVLHLHAKSSISPSTRDDWYWRGVPSAFHESRSELVLHPDGYNGCSASDIALPGFVLYTNWFQQLQPRQKLGGTLPDNGHSTSVGSADPIVSEL